MIPPRLSAKVIAHPNQDRVLKIGSGSGARKRAFCIRLSTRLGTKNLISKVGKALGVSEYSPSLSKFSKNPVIFQNFVSNLRFCIKNLNRI